MHKAGPWTNEAIERLRIMKAEGKRVGEIAAAVGRTVAAVEKKASRLDIKSPLAKYKPTVTGAIHPKRGYDPVKATSAHLQDILKEHGFDKRWQDYTIPHFGSAHSNAYYATYRSVTGSSAAMCAVV